MWKFKTPGIPDNMFNQNESVPGPTKEEIRVVTISKARLNPGDLVIEVGCGTGGLTVEAALQVGEKGKIFAIDEDEKAVELTQKNVNKFEVKKIVNIIQSNALEIVKNLPMCNAFLVGGSRSLEKILQVANEKLRAGGRIVINAIMIETACVAIDELKKLNFQDIDVAEIIVAKGRIVPSGTMMMSRNPIFIISATKL